MRVVSGVHPKGTGGSSVRSTTCTSVSVAQYQIHKLRRRTRSRVGEDSDSLWPTIRIGNERVNVVGAGQFIRRAEFVDRASYVAHRRFAQARPQKPGVSQVTRSEPEDSSQRSTRSGSSPVSR
jgi:hypothetical protein